MTRAKRNGILLLGALACLISLPMTWMTFHAVPGAVGSSGTFIVDLLRMFPSEAVHIPVTGLKGKFSLLGQHPPIWIVLCVSIAAAPVLIFNRTSYLDLPKFIVLLLAASPFAWAATSMGTALSTGAASPGPGLFFGLAGMLMPVMCAFLHDVDLTAADTASHPND